MHEIFLKLNVETRAKQILKYYMNKAAEGSLKNRAMDNNSISDENKKTVAATSTISAAIAETSMITKTPDDNRCHQCVNNDDNNDINYSVDDECVNSDNNEAINRYDKISAATLIYPSQVNSTTDPSIPFIDDQINCHSNISRTKDLVHKCQSDPGGRLSMRSQINRSPRILASGAANMATTTRKCVLTLDGYNYVIGKLFHSNKLKREKKKEGQ